MISKEEVIKLAKLARLDFSDDELDKIIKDMDDIIAFADTINNSVEGDADKIRNISTSATPAEEFRKDEVKPSLPKRKNSFKRQCFKGIFLCKGRYINERNYCTFITIAQIR